MWWVVTTGAISHAKLQSNHHHQQTNIQFLQAGCPSCRPTKSVKALKGKISHSMDLLTTLSSPGGLPTLCLTTNSSWLPWGRVAMPLISPLMQYPNILCILYTRKQPTVSKHWRKTVKVRHRKKVVYYCGVADDFPRLWDTSADNAPSVLCRLLYWPDPQT